MKGACFRISTRLFLRPSLQPLLSPTRASPAFSSRFVSSKSCNMVKVDEELLSGYGPANYCPLQPNSVLDDSYTAVVKLGYGRTSTTWLCTDCQYVPFVAHGFHKLICAQQRCLQSSQGWRSRCYEKGEVHAGKLRNGYSTYRGSG